MAIKRSALVIGAGQGIGAAVAIRMAADNYNVVVADLNEKGAQSTVASLAEGDHKAVKMDLCSEESIIATINGVSEDYGSLDTMVCVAGGPMMRPDHHPIVKDFPLDEWRKIIEFNLTGSFMATKAYLQAASRSAPRHGRVVLFSSAAGEVAGAITGSAYAAAKAGVIGFTRYAAMEAARMGITVNAVAPGPTDTPAFWESCSKEDEAVLTNFVPLGRMAKADEIADGVVWLCSKGASYVTGTTLDINGGVHMH